MKPSKSLTILMALAAMLAVPATAAARKPNVILIFVDDMGYNDLSCYGSEKIKTPNLDRLASEGKRFTSFMVPSSVCSPSRAALLTGCYPKRVDMEKHVLFPQSRKGINPDEYTLADHFSSAGYATTAIGKWHLGHYPETLPRVLGFGSYYGIPYSNDMNHPDNKGKASPASDESWENQSESVKLWHTPLVENETIIELPADQRTITRRYTERAIGFIDANKEKPFFIYLPHSMPHIPLFVPEDVLDPDPANAYTCTIEHIDAEIGRIMAKVREEGLDKETIIIFTSDNGPWIRFKNHGGNADPLREGKGTPFEGGQRVPCIMWAPGRIPAGTVSDELVTSMDLLPTLAAMTDIPLPENGKPIDGINLSPTITGQSPSARHEFIYYTANGELIGLRKDGWKLLLNPAGKKREPMLFNITKDMGEKKDLSATNKEIVGEMTTRMLELDKEIESNRRPAWTTREDHPWPDEIR
ncbi:sulfatase [Akkermansiaceae bacterium]|nr:sulfatase [Akkermansiaceae bacterium]